MNRMSSIITVGLCPCWDMVLRFDGIEWGDHKLVNSSDSWPAGKALNISHALAWIGEKNIAAGLWGKDDFELMLKAIRKSGELIKVKMTAVEGSTRRNVTIVDTANDREMHMRNRSELTSEKAISQLEADLTKIVKRGGVCVFAGLMPEEEYIGDVVQIIKSCKKQGAGIVVDTHGLALKEIIDTGSAWMIKPNVEELRELLCEEIKDSPAALARAGRKLLDKVAIVLISRGSKGAVVVTSKGAWQGKCVGSSRVLSTVGCGDFLLAGFLKGLKDKSDFGSALRTGIKVGTARAWGWAQEKSWPQIQREIKVEVKQL